MKSKINLLPRGFTTKAERLAEEFRKKLKLYPWGHLCAFDLASYLGVSVCQETDYGFDSGFVECLDGWSGLYLINKWEEKIIIYNGSHSPARQQSTVMHELAHLVCGHPLPSETLLPHLPFLRHYEARHEQEAEYLGGTLQITRKGLVWAKNRNMSTIQMSDYFNASPEMINYRLNISGVNRQFSIKQK